MPHFLVDAPRPAPGGGQAYLFVDARGARWQFTDAHSRTVPASASGARLEWFPDGRRVAVSADDTAIRIHAFDGRPVEHLSHVEGTRDELGFISGDGRHLYFSSNRHTRGAMQLLRCDLERGSAATLFGDEQYDARWCRDMRWRGYHLFTLHESPLVRHLMGVNVESGETVWLSPQGELTMDAVEVLDDDTLLIATTMGRTFASLARFSPESRDCSYLFEETWDQRGCMHGARDRLLCVENQAGRDVVRLYNWPQLEPLACTLPADGAVGDIRLDDARSAAYLQWQSPRHASRILRVDLATGMTTSAVGADTAARAAHFELELRRFAGDDGEPLWAWHYIPPVRDSTWPTVVWLHDGPFGQARAVFRPLFQRLLSRGIAILAPNLRGSLGFGARYARDAFGDGEVRDLFAAVRWARSDGGARRLALMGEGHGAQLALRGVVELAEEVSSVVGLSFASHFPPDMDGPFERARAHAPLLAVTQWRGFLSFDERDNDRIVSFVDRHFRAAQGAK